jgi:ABC-2 type transport system ATP-binding protein
MGKIVALGTPDELKARVGGDVITIATANNSVTAGEIAERYGITPAVDNGTLRVEVSDGAAFVPRLVRELSQAVTTVTLRRPSLDDVFLKLTGHAIREEQAGALDHLRSMGARWGAKHR